MTRSVKSWPWPLTPRVEVAVDLLAHDRLAVQAAHALFRTLHLAEHHSTQAYTVNRDQLDYYNASSKKIITTTQSTWINYNALSDKIITTIIKI